MSTTTVTVYAEQPATIEDRMLRLDETTWISLPLNHEQGAEWCRNLAGLLTAEADRMDEQHQQALRDLEAARAYLQGVIQDGGPA